MQKALQEMARIGGLSVRILIVRGELGIDMNFELFYHWPVNHNFEKLSSPESPTYSNRMITHAVS